VAKWRIAKLDARKKKLGQGIRQCGVIFALLLLAERTQKVELYEKLNASSIAQDEQA
jgi:hypothetical protein